MLHTARREITSAANLVSSCLQLGPWPSPYRSLDPNNHDVPNNNYEAHFSHMSMIGASLEKFAHDILLPALLEDVGTNELRVFLGALLMIREVLILNAGTIFGSSAMLTGCEADFGDTLVVSSNNNSYNDQADDAQETALFSVQVLATTVILTGLAEIGDNQASENLSEEFLKVLESYELGDKKVEQCLEVICDNVMGVFPNRQRMQNLERRAWASSTNFQRERHPLIDKNAVIKPSAVHVSILQSVRRDT